MKRILFIDTNQYGYLTDSLKWCELLKDKYDITYISICNGRPKIVTPKVKTIYVPNLGTKAVRGLLFLVCAFIHCLFFSGFIFVIYHEKLDLLKRLLPWKKMHLDIRTLCVDENKEIRDYQDSLLRKSALAFDSVSAISKGVIKRLGINKKVFTLPLGADIISKTAKDFSTLRLLYIGTMTNRHIPQTIKGIQLFVKKHPQIKITYDIIGGDNGEGELAKVKASVKEAQLESIIIVHGPILHSKLKPFLDGCNIGICYVPITDYYQYQPPTKTFEYAFSGLATIATSTYANEEIINDKNGVLIKDTPESFCSGIENVLTKNFNSDDIRKSVKDYSWTNVVRDYLIPIIEQ